MTVSQATHVAGWTARQPGLGVAGLFLVAPVALILGWGAGGPQESLLVLGPLSTFALPVIAMIAFWWEDWPGSRLRPGWSGFTDTLLVVAGAVVLAALGQVLVDHFDLRGLFDPTPGSGHAATFPATMPLAGVAFVAMLQLTLVSEGWPLKGHERTAAGFAAIAVSWAIAAAAYLLLVDGGLLAGAALGAWLVAVGAWQVCLFVVLRGWPLSRIARQGPRVAAANAVVIGGGWLTYVALRGAGVENEAISAAAGAVVAGGLLVGMLFDGWPGSSFDPASGRVVALGAVALASAALFALLSAYADGIDWTRGSAEEWVSYAGLNAIGAGVILHVGIGRRYPFARDDVATREAAAS
jgi:hypothetical protein